MRAIRHILVIAVVLLAGSPAHAMVSPCNCENTSANSAVRVQLHQSRGGCDCCRKTESTPKQDPSDGHCCPNGCPCLMACHVALTCLPVVGVFQLDVAQSESQFVASAQQPVSTGLESIFHPPKA